MCFGQSIVGIMTRSGTQFSEALWEICWLELLCMSSCGVTEWRVD